MEQLTKLHRQLGALKRKLADTMKPFNQPATDMSVGAWEPRLQFIRGLREDAKVLENAAYELATDDQEFDKEVERFANFEQILLEAEVKISKLKIPAEEKPPMIPGSSERGSRLPTISLKTFSGRHEDWNAFFAQFTSMIHNQKDLSAVDKFYYLVSYLSGEAFQVVKELEIVESNYEIALELLKNAYEDKRLIIRKYINQLLNLKPIVTESAAELRALCNVVNQFVSVLKKMGLHIDKWNGILVCLVETKLDKVSRRDWEETISANKEFPTFEELNTFLTRRSKMLRSLSNSTASTPKQTEEKRGSQGFTKRKTLVVSGEDTQVSCKLCNETGHRLRQCEAFQRLGIEERINKARELSLCLNCLGPGNHTSRQCKFGKCRKCGKSHNTLLHRITDTPSSDALAGNSVDNSGAASNQTAVNGTGNALPASRRQGDAQVMLATAVVYVFDRFGKKQMCRVGLDSYGQSNFITENLCQKLQLQKSTCNISISGIGDSSLFFRHSANVTIKSRYSGAELNMNALVIPVITDNLPSALFDPAKLKLPPYVQLADPEFYVPKKIDMLVGAEFFFQILIPGQMIATPNLPTLQNTIYGWVLSGSLDLSEETQEQNQASTSAVICNLSVEENLSDQLTKFWEIEQPTPPEQTLTQEEYICEQHFVTNTKRDETGQFVVRLPLKKETSDLGTSYQGALRRFLSLERRLENNPEVKAKYHDFMAEYLALGHMNEVGPDQIMYQPSYFLPHHCVFNENSTTTRLRVVFDASHKTSSGKSLNDILCVGAQTQPELMTILLNFRMGEYAISADIRRMYRMVKVDNRDIGLQQILWRFDQDQAVSTYALNTVTYGTACAPFLATRCLLELANIGASTFPLASKATRENFYMDDLLVSVSTPDKAEELLKQLINLLHSANFQLHKWHTNHTPLLDTIKTAQQTSEPPQISEVTHALGIEWRPQTDEFTVKVPDIDPESAITRRSILSDTAKLFDPLGLISPVVVRAKMFMQDLCRVKMSWDEPVDAEQCRLWQKYRQELLTINSLKYPRWVIGHNGTGKIQIHGFCDASLRAMGCVIYIRFETDEGEIFVQLLCAKSRVTPLKKGTYTIPRLELCAAELLAKVSNRVQTDLRLKEVEMFLWSDSTITLSWISQDSAQFKIFVARRIHRIQSLTKDATWQHVCSKDNPTDIVSRGATVRDLKASSLWFKGPAWLSSPQKEWPTSNAVRDSEVRNYYVR
ncbi:uncharacterized protein LOC129808837 [Phlebotomus papatasi]|uniref:uncharacterized protein LOC129808837 n=1 Tax=Phlebotomus papatasi TaxID=29031 RepID=UPI0024841F5D|nr:uncharacterized protein LOC129808837 [Phlebotomus papatasi]